MAGDLTYEGTLTILTCWCGMRHAVPEELRAFQQRQHRDGARDVTGIYCPLGHQHVPSGKGEAERLREKLAAEEERAARILANLDQEQASHRATKGQLTKAKKRVANGVCPCCHRSFVQLARHMKTQHPTFEGGEIT